MRKILFSALVALMAFSFALPALAQEPEAVLNSDFLPKQVVAKFKSRNVVVRGELLSIKSDAPAELTVKVKSVIPKKAKKGEESAHPSTDKILIVKITDKTKFVRKYWGKSSLEELTVGDLLYIVGKTNEDASVNASLVKDESLHWTFRIHVGEVQSVDLANNSFVIKQKNEQLITVKTNVKTKFVIPGKDKGALADIQVGDRVHVRGIINTKTKVLTASFVRVRPEKALPPVTAPTSTVPAAVSS